MKRIEWIDFAKSLMIFFIVLLHTHCNSVMVTMLNAIVMPMFFFMSGFLFSLKRNPSYFRFVYKRFRQLVVPYLWINLVAYFIWLLILRKYGNDAAESVEWYSPLLGITFGIPSELIHDIPLWSLLCFFIVEIIFYPLYKWVNKSLLISIFFIVIAGINNHIFGDNMKQWPLCLAPLPASMAFYSFGFYMRNNNYEIVKQKIGNYFVLLLLLLYVIASNMNVFTSFFTGYLGNYPLYLLSAFAGCFFIVQLCIIISNKIGDLKIIQFISNGTLLICGFHLLTLAFIKGILLFVFKIEPFNLTDNLLGGILFALGAYVLCFPIIYIVRTYFKPLVDK